MLEQYGFHRVADAKAAFPQSSQRLNPFPPYYENELVVAVDQLHLDSASFQSLKQQHGASEDKIKSAIKAIVEENGKMQNPVTGSGGVLTGTVQQLSEKYFPSVKKGNRIISLVSLTLCPLILQSINHVDLHTGIAYVEGTAVLFEKTIFYKLKEEDDIHQTMQILDVCGAPKLTQVYSKDAKNILILGAGKSGILSAFAAFDSGVPEITIIENSSRRLNDLYDLKLPFNILNGDAKDYIYFEKYQEKFDLTLDCLNIPNAEMASIIATKKEGTIIFFNTATSFTQAALGAEGIGNNVRMIIGNGYYPEHAEYALSMIRKYPVLLKLLNEESS